MISDGELRQMIREGESLGYSTIVEALVELEAYRQAFSEPYAYEVKGILCHTLEEAKVFVGEPEPLFAKPTIPS